MNDVVVTIVLLASLIFAPYTSYRMGRWMERKAYTKVFVREVEAAYFDGYNDAIQGLKP